MKYLYFVSSPGERHEDHIPSGVFTFEEFKGKFPNIVQEEEFEPNVWKEIICLDTDEFSPQEIQDILSSKETFEKHIEEYQKYYDGYYICNVIRIVVGQNFPPT